jgi:hypothetical protein
MAFVADDTTQEDAAKAQQDRLSQTQTGGGGSGGLFGATPQGGNSAAGQNPAPTSNSSNTGFTNLQKYLDANGEQSAKMGSDVGGAVDTQATGAKQQASDLNNNFNSGVQANTVNADPDAVGRAITDATTMPAPSPASGNGATAPASSWGADMEAFGKQAGAKYNGPTDFTTQGGYGGAASAASNADTAVKQLGSDAGRGVLLNNQYANASKNGYTTGENTLDASLLAASPSAQSALQGVRDKWNGSSLVNALNGYSTAGNAAAHSADLTDQATAAAAAKALGTWDGTPANGTAAAIPASGALGTFNQALQDKYTAAQKSYTDANAGIKADIAAGKLTPADLTAMGATAGTQTYGLSPLDYVHAGTSPTLANTATPEQYAQAQALGQLAGYLPSIAGAPGGAGAAGLNPLNPSYASQAGTAGPAYTFDNKQFGSDVAGRQSTYNQKMQDIYNGVTNNGARVFPSAAPTEAQAAANPQALTSFIQNLLNQNPNYIQSSDPNYNLSSLSNEATQLSNTYGPGMTLGNLSGNLTDVGGQGRAGGAPTTPNGTPALAFGGKIPMPTATSVASPVKEPKIPKLQRPDIKLPTMPHFAEGGAAPAEVDGPNTVDQNTAIIRALADKYGLGTSAYPSGSNYFNMSPQEQMQWKNAQAQDPNKGGANSVDSADLIKLARQHLAEGGDVLDANARKHIASKNFAEPAQHKYPIHDIEHARNALARVAQNGTPEEQEVVRRQVHAHYPSLASPQKMAEGGAPTFNQDRVKQFQKGSGWGPSPTPSPTPSSTPTPKASPSTSPSTWDDIKSFLSYAEGGTTPTPTPSPSPKSPENNDMWGQLKAALKQAEDNRDGNFKGGGKVPGKAKTPSGTNSYDNDNVQAVLSPQEIVLPRTVTQGPNPGDDAKAFVERELAKNKKEER